MADREDMLDALRRQSTACAALGSSLYADLLDGLALDYEGRGITWRLLADRPERALHDAVPLRLLGAVHRIVLRGDAPALAARYPSAGGDGRPVDVADVLAVLETHAQEIATELGTAVQTNEVARCALLVVGFTALARESGLPLRLLEVGASAGLNLNWDRYWYDTGSSRTGDPTSAVRFDATTEPPAWAEAVDVSGDAQVAEARGCDASPLDPTEPSDRRRLLSFVWPDQLARFARLQAALEIAATHPPTVEEADAGEWIARALDVPAPGTCTVVYHSIVWQYLGEDSRALLRAALRQAGSVATPERPLAWLRMEPAGPVTDLRVTTWPGSIQRTLAHGGYHGQGVRSGPPD
jgi:hypothetical protein